MCVLCCVVLLCVGLRCVALGCAGLCFVGCVVCVCVGVGTGGLVACLQTEGRGAWCVVRGASLAIRGSSCCWALVALCWWFRFWAWSMIAICGRLCGPQGVIDGSCGSYGSFLVWGGRFRAWEDTCGMCLNSRGRRVRASPSEVYPAAKLQWHFTCGFDFSHLWPLLHTWRV